jgi:hypothetical protein
MHSIRYATSFGSKGTVGVFSQVDLLYVGT